MQSSRGTTRPSQLTNKDRLGSIALDALLRLLLRAQEAETRRNLSIAHKSVVSTEPSFAAHLSEQVECRTLFPPVPFSLPRHAGMASLFGRAITRKILAIESVQMLKHPHDALAFLEIHPYRNLTQKRWLRLGWDLPLFLTRAI